MLTEPAAKPRRRPAVLTAIIASLVAVLAAGTGAYFLLKPGEFTITGSVVVESSGVYPDTAAPGESCRFLSSGHRDLPGAQVVVTDASGTVVATSRLDSGYYTTSPRQGCEFRFRATVPDGEKFYGLQVGRREGMTLTRDELNKPLELTLN